MPGHARVTEDSLKKGGRCAQARAGVILSATGPRREGDTGGEHQPKAQVVMSPLGLGSGPFSYCLIIGVFASLLMWNHFMPDSVPRRDVRTPVRVTVALYHTYLFEQSLRSIAGSVVIGHTYGI